MEWTIEQREQAAEKVRERQYEGLGRKSRRSNEFNRTAILYNNADVQARVAVDLQCELTAALSEAQRLRSELAKDDVQMGELAVGGASSENQGERLTEKERVRREFPNAWCRESSKGGAYRIYAIIAGSMDPIGDWCTTEALAWEDVAENLPAPPSGEQSQVEGFPVEISLGDAFPAQTALSAEAPILAPSGEQAAPRQRVGIRVPCAVCGHQKKPRGRSAPMGLKMCDDECPGYSQEPRVGDLWPGETQEDFGYPVSADGTELAPIEVQSPKGEVK